MVVVTWLAASRFQAIEEFSHIDDIFELVRILRGQVSRHGSLTILSDLVADKELLAERTRVLQHALRCKVRLRCRKRPASSIRHHRMLSRLKKWVLGGEQHVMLGRRHANFSTRLLEPLLLRQRPTGGVSCVDLGLRGGHPVLVAIKIRVRRNSLVDRVIHARPLREKILCSDF